MRGNVKNLAILLIITLGFLTACAAAPATLTPTADQPAVEDNRVSASARVIPQRFTTLSFISGGQQIQLLVKQGDPVTAGQMIAQANTDQLKIAVAQAEAALRQARANLSQLESPPSKEAVKAAEAVVASAEYTVKKQIDDGANNLQMRVATSARESAYAALDAVNSGARPEQLDIARAAVDQSSAAVDQAKLALEQSKILAPFAGEIVEVYLHDFENAQPGAPVVLLADLTTLKIETTDLSEVDTARIKTGDVVKISYDAFPGQDGSGKVGRIALKAAAGSGVNYTIEIIPDSIPTGLRWGMSSFVVFEIP
jgi:multidrug efflux pump subunit AcrA (membrane-fusion protein)